MINDIQLVDKSNTVSSKLSGGMKRKLRYITKFYSNYALTKQFLRLAGWPSGQRVGLAIRRSWVLVPRWPLAGFVRGCPEFKTSATLTRSACILQWGTKVLRESHKIARFCVVDIYIPPAPPVYPHPRPQQTTFIRGWEDLRPLNRIELHL